METTRDFIVMIENFFYFISYIHQPNFACWLAFWFILFSTHISLHKCIFELETVKLQKCILWYLLCSTSTKEPFYSVRY
ncbi:hypothetical protein BD560DRAFT_400310 [Blakeslea trispora]|nr:hypothetical protein BD560DRAFT_400310 [Blakeslea trispora]